MTVSETEAQATQMTIEKFKKEQEVLNKLKRIKEDNQKRAADAGFTTSTEHAANLKKDQPHLQPLPVPAPQTSVFNSADQVFKQLSGQGKINDKLKKLPRLD